MSNLVTSKYEGCVKLIGWIVIAICMFFIYGFVIMKGYNWYILPYFDVPQLSYKLFVGVYIGFSALLMLFTPIPKNKSLSLQQVGLMLGKPVSALVFLYIGKLVIASALV